MELRQLRHFLAVLEHRNFRRAAGSLAITPQALNASIVKLENELDLKLFERGRNGLDPTRYADLLARHASLICSETERAKRTLSQIVKANEGHVAIGAGWFTSQVLGCIAVEKLMQLYPGVDLTFVEGSSEDLHMRLLRGELDIVLSTPSQDLQLSPELRVEELWRGEDRVHARRDHPLSALGDSVPLARMTGYPWIVSAGTESRTPRLLQACRQNNVEPPRKLIRTNSVYALQRLMAQTDALMLGGALPPPFELPLMERCTRFSVPELQETYRVLLAWREDPPLSTVAWRFIEAVRESFQSGVTSA